MAITQFASIFNYVQEIKCTLVLFVVNSMKFNNKGYFFQVT